MLEAGLLVGVAPAQPLPIFHQPLLLHLGGEPRHGLEEVLLQPGVQGQGGALEGGLVRVGEVREGMLGRARQRAGPASASSALPPASWCRGAPPAPST